MKTIAIVNKKGGVGKTSICFHTAGVLADQGRVLVVDMDDQGSISSFFIKNVHSISPTINDLLSSDPETSIQDVIQKTHIENIHILPCNITMKTLDARLAGDPDAQFYLLEALQEISGYYNYILIDCPPSLGQATRMAMVAAESIIAPLECDNMAVDGAKLLLAAIDQTKKRANPNLKFLGFIINKYMRRAVDISYNNAIRNAYGNKVFKTEFRNNVQFKEASTKHLPITHYLPGSDQADNFREFVKEIF